ncbi:hypothetical protein [Litoribacillus peritrichatus]|uniref:HNH endonuclease n=1 Tax=Litoribacillus peritrichatus TaxID=718191 RepID=A0ABP7ME46_9GAMM
MNEVLFSGKELELVNDFKDLKDKRSVSWGDDKFSILRKQIKDHYLVEQNYTCCFCRQRIVVKSNRAWDAEHIISKSTHPDFMFEPRNLCISCPDCNNEKSDKQVLDRDNRVRFPENSRAYKIVHPHFDKYEEHLNVIVEGKLYKWKTPKGRNTIRIYGLDRFLEDTGRNNPNRANEKSRNIMASALSNSQDYEKLEMELLQHLVLKNADRIGAEETINMLKKLEE